MALKTADITPPEYIFAGLKGIGSAGDILDRLKELKKIEAKYETRAKIAAAQRNKLASAFSGMGKDIAALLKSLQGIMGELDEYEKRLEIYRGNVAQGAKEGEMHFRRAAEHIKTLTNMYDVFKKEEKKGDARKTELAAKAYQKARSNAEKDIGPVTQWLMMLDDTQRVYDKINKTEFEQNLRDLAQVLGHLTRLLGQKKDLDGIQDDLAKQKQMIKDASR